MGWNQERSIQIYVGAGQGLKMRISKNKPNRELDWKHDSSLFWEEDICRKRICTTFYRVRLPCFFNAKKVNATVIRHVYSRGVIYRINAMGYKTCFSKKYGFSVGMNGILGKVNVCNKEDLMEIASIHSSSKKWFPSRSIIFGPEIKGNEWVISFHGNNSCLYVVVKGKVLELVDSNGFAKIKIIPKRKKSVFLDKKIIFEDSFIPLVSCSLILGIMYMTEWESPD